MSNFDISIEQRLLLGNLIRIIGYLAAFVFYYYKTKDVKFFAIFFLLGYLGSEFASIVENLITLKQINVVEYLKTGARNSGTFLFTFLGLVFYKNTKNNLILYGLAGAILGNSIVKFNCFIIGDLCYGKPTTSAFGIIVNGLNPSFTTVHPATIYDSLFFILLFLLLLWLISKFQFHQLLIYSTYLLISLYGFLIEFIRINPKVFYSFTINQAIYFLVFLLNIIFIALFVKKNCN